MFHLFTTHTSSISFSKSSTYHQFSINPQLHIVMFHFYFVKYDSSITVLKYCDENKIVPKQYSLKLTHYFTVYRMYCTQIFIIPVHILYARQGEERSVCGRDRRLTMRMSSMLFFTPALPHGPHLLFPSPVLQVSATSPL